MQKDLKALSELYSRIIVESNGRKVIRGRVVLTGLYLNELPKWLADVEVTGDFNCGDNLLTSLKNAPKKVGGDFYCPYNRLTSLQGAPESVGGDFFCAKNKLTSLQGAPEIIGGDFYCYGNPVLFAKRDVRAVSKVRGSITIR